MGKRFVREYALSKMQNIKKSETISAHEKSEKAARIERILAYYTRSMMTDDEAIKAILES